MADPKKLQAKLHKAEAVAARDRDRLRAKAEKKIARIKNELRAEEAKIAAKLERKRAKTAAKVTASADVPAESRARRRAVQARSHRR